MKYDEFIKLLGEYCENNVEMSINSFVNTIKSLIKDKEIVNINKKYIENIERRITNNSYVGYSTLEGEIYGILINVDKNSILLKIKDNSDTLKILGISEQCYSGILKYINKEEAWKAYED